MWPDQDREETRGRLQFAMLPSAGPSFPSARALPRCPMDGSVLWRRYPHMPVRQATSARPLECESSRPTHLQDRTEVQMPSSLFVPLPKKEARLEWGLITARNVLSMVLYSTAGPPLVRVINHDSASRDVPRDLIVAGDRGRTVARPRPPSPPPDGGRAVSAELQ